MNYVSDTHALLWWFTDSPRISSKAAEVFVECERGRNVIFIPSIVIAEALSIFDKKRIDFDFGTLLETVNYSENFALIALDYPILAAMVDLTEIPELHDKIIVATANYLRYPIITKDNAIQDFNNVETVW